MNEKFLHLYEQNHKSISIHIDSIKNIQYVEGGFEIETASFVKFFPFNATVFGKTYMNINEVEKKLGFKESGFSSTHYIKKDE